MLPKSRLHVELNVILFIIIVTSTTNILLKLLLLLFNVFTGKIKIGFIIKIFSLSSL